MTLDPNVFTFLIEASKPGVKSQNTVTVESLLVKQWTNLIYSLNYLDIVFVVNAVQVGTVTLSNKIVDSPDYLKHTGDVFIGYIYSICIHNALHTVITIEIGQCDPDYDCVYCPEDTCLSECEFDQLIQEDNSCEDCADECAEGCIRATDCRKCEDPLCAVCDTYGHCLECIVGTEVPYTPGDPCACSEGTVLHYSEDICKPCDSPCEECTHGDRICTKCEDGWYLPPLPEAQICLKCHESCETCSTSGINSCDTCPEGTSKSPDLDRCIEGCPTGYSQNNGDCENIDSSLLAICFTFDDKIIETTSLTTSTVLNAQEPESHPTPSIFRGLYFDGDDTILLENIILNTIVNIEFWIKPENSGSLLSVGDNLAEFRLDELNPSLLLSEQIINSSATVQNEWVNLVYSLKNDVVNFYINGVQIEVEDVAFDPSAFLIDSASNSHIIAQGYTGFLYKFCIHQGEAYTPDIDPESDCTVNDCTSCPVDKCLSECELTQFINQDGTCEDCLEECEEGCVIGTRCILCLDELCNTCTNYSPCDSDGCIDTAIYSEEQLICVCPEDLQYDRENEVCTECPLRCAECEYGNPSICLVCEDGSYLDETNDPATCELCAGNCATCDEGEEWDCLTCLENYVMLADLNKCETQCPSGFTATGTPPTCTFDGDESATYCFEFTDKTLQLQSNNVRILPPTTAAHKPKPILNRGIHFDGDDTLTLENLFMNTKVTIEFWIRAESDGSLLAINTDYANFAITTSTTGLIMDSVTYAGDSVEKAWTYVVFKITSEAIPTVEITVNRSVMPAQDLSTYFIDMPTYLKVIGTDYQGYLYKICIKNYLETVSDIDANLQCVDVYESAVPPTGQCLSECEFDEYIEDDKSCGACKEECVDGCVRDTDCRKCTDLLCKTCDSFHTCKICIEGAEKTPAPDGPCLCLDDTEWHHETDKCGECSDGCNICSPGDLCCEQCAEGFYAATPESCTCDPCDPKCELCLTGDNTQCDSCNEDYFQTPGTKICESFCPTGFTPIEGECEDHDTSMCFTFVDKEIEMTVQGVSLVLGDIIEEQPTSVYLRGIYFTGGQGLSVESLILNTSFTLEWTIRPEADGSLFDVENSANFLKIDLFESQLRFVQKTYDSLLQGSWSEKTWYNMAIAVELLDFKAYIDNVQVSIETAITEVVIDQPTHEHTLARNYQGFLYEFCIHQYIKTPFEVPTDLNNCDIDQSPPDCQNECLEECIDGCIRPYDCRPCVDVLCEECQSFEGDCEEDRCIENAIWNNGLCECLDPNYYQNDQDICVPCVSPHCLECSTTDTCDRCEDGWYVDELTQVCLPCDNRCTVCEDITNTKCDTCTDGNFQTPNTRICEPYCPTGLGQLDGVCQETPQVSIQFEFDDQTITLESKGATIEVINEETAPCPVYQRGIYFNNSEGLKINDLILNTKFTLEYIVRPEAAGQLLAITNDTTNILISQLSTAGEVLLQKEFDPVIATFTEEPRWYNIGFQVDLTSVKVYEDSAQVSALATLNELVIDSPTYLHTLGANY